MADREYELKFTIDPRGMVRLLSHPALAASQHAWRESRLLSTYFDTPEEALRQRHVSLRVRHEDDAVKQTLKRAGGSKVDRDEWERDGGGPQPDEAWLAGTPLGALFAKKAVAGALVPRFTVDVRRTAMPILYADGVLEGALDLGEIRAGAASLPVAEFEIEWKSGSRAAVLALGRELARDLPIDLSLTGKAERGYALADGSWGQPTAAVALGQKRKVALAPAFEAVVQACLQMLLANAALLPGALAGEAVHKTRIAARRLRGILQLFKPALRPEVAGPLNDELKWLSRKLGAARDADVFQHTTFDAAVQAGMPGAAPLADIMRLRQTQAHADLREALASRRGRTLMLDILACSQDGLLTACRDRRYRPFVTRRLNKRWRALTQQASHLSRLPSEAVHDVRKSAKTLRYNLDLLRDTRQAMPGRGLRRLQADLQALQETLGTLHDGEAIREHLTGITFGDAGLVGSEGLRQQAAFAAGLLAAAPSNPRETLKQAKKALRRIARTPPSR